MAWRIPMVDLAAEYEEVGPALEEAVLRVLRSGRYVLGPETEAFEAEMAALTGAPFAVGVGSGTEALVLALRAVGVAAGDEVVIPAFTYFATAEAVLLCGATPVFADIERESFALDPATFEAAVTSRTRAVIPVHLFGRCADMERIGEAAARRDVAVVEDAAQAIGAGTAGRRAGAWGVAGCFSFHPSKVLGAAGDGGCVTTTDANVREQLLLLRSHGISPDGGHVLAGTTSRLDALQAAVLRAKLPHLKLWTDARARNARIYGEELAGCPGLALPAAGIADEVIWNNYTLRCRDPQAVRAALERHGVESRRYYPRPACCEPGLGPHARPAEAFPEASRACAEVVSIPVRGSLEPETIREIAAIVRGAAREGEAAAS